ncbi:MAG TPA: prepilin peptidase [Edaphobacter sp.]|jgi:leader peptidase (prepilin peptidase)/N-methyltransferase
MSDKAYYLGEGLLIFGIYIPLVLFLIGLLFGSFLNVCIHRLPQRLSVVRPRSHCTSCGSSIPWYDNIPVLSVLILRGRCRNCGEAIRFQYIAVEIGFAAWLAMSFFAATGNPEGLFLPFLNLAILGFLLIGLLVMDWQTMILPDAFTLGGIAVALFLVCTQAIFLGPGEDEVHLTKHSLHLTSPGGVTDHGNLFLTGPESLIFGRIAAVCGAALVLLLIRWLYRAIRHREGMGLGDVKLLAMIAAFLGFWPAVLSLFVGTLAAAFYGALLLARGKAEATSKLAFGSFLCVGGLVAALYGNRLIDSYIALLR